ncbi:unnamed protein product [Discula destructiva]
MFDNRCNQSYTFAYGTHIAGIILELTNNVDIYVGKIALSREIDDTAPIVKAIQHAKKEWHVNIISISFGFHDNVDRELYGEIQAALDSKILIFAAASNDGGNGSRAYPASHDGVFCIHSATSEGNKASFNPTPRAMGDNFSVVGNEIESAWLGNSMKCQSGTSFAIPVAVAVAALMYGCISRTMPEHTRLPLAVLSPPGMRQVFHLLKQPRDGYDWIRPL